ncbi:MAG TPA: hypothetical protein VGO68_05705 [Pyrinomonadaceae bacterium]|jgi:hypothetical protein|nr:hypothetical protein [Pyrinomonadaceae bacterium]
MSADAIGAGAVARQSWRARILRLRLRCNDPFGHKALHNCRATAPALLAWHHGRDTTSSDSRLPLNLIAMTKRTHTVKWETRI